MKLGRREFLAASVGLLAGVVTSDTFFKEERRRKMEKPNLIFVLTDDQAQWALGAYGNEDIHTPNMDRLAKEGMLFTRAFTAPVCSPSRAMIMAGLYAHQVGIDDWISPQETEGMDPEKPTLAEAFKKAGYTTALIGKWHLGKEERYHPLNRGFDYFMGFLGGGNRPKDPTLIIDGKEQQVEGYLTDILTDDAVRFIRENRGRPFALFLHTRAPHMPYTPVPEEDMAHYEGKRFKVPKVENFPEERLQREYREYYASISSIDRNLGRILDLLEELDLEENTIVIFMGDNGYMIGHHGLETKGNAWFIGTRTRRPNMFDLSILVPLIIRWPKVIGPGTVCDEMVSSIDFFPTFLDVLKEAGCEVPEGIKLEGMSMLPLLGGEHVRWRNEICMLYDMHHGAEAHMRMIRTDRWKLVLHYEEGGENELYDLESDPGEERNLYGKESVAKIQKELAERLAGWRHEVDDPISEL
ncbi:sulfatase-like hydrolase/transferase [Candidatus Poribacteria bacterium]|nr:sulfatase-like hydrolase/transferase [Candidatus Poribacteria bacterium]